MWGRIKQKSPPEPIKPIKPIDLINKIIEKKELKPLTDISKSINSTKNITEPGVVLCVLSGRKKVDEKSEKKIEKKNRCASPYCNLERVRGRLACKNHLCKNKNCKSRNGYITDSYAFCRFC